MTNDERILNLKQQIQIKKEAIGKAKRFSPLTNCFIELDGVRQNIQALSKEQLIQLLVKLNAYQASAKELGLLKEYVISGFNIEDWLSDIQARLAILIKKEDEKSLKRMEEKLTSMLTDGKKIELEIDEIESMFKGN